MAQPDHGEEKKIKQSNKELEDSVPEEDTRKRTEQIVSYHILCSPSEVLENIFRDQDITETDIDLILDINEVCNLMGVTKALLIRYTKNFVRENIVNDEVQANMLRKLRKSFRNTMGKEAGKERKVKLELEDYLKKLTQSEFEKIDPSEELSETKQDDLLKQIYPNAHSTSEHIQIKNTMLVVFPEVVRAARAERDKMLVSLKESVKEELQDLVQKESVCKLGNIIKGLNLPTASSLERKANQCTHLFKEEDINELIKQYFKDEHRYVKATYESKRSALREHLRKEIVVGILSKIPFFCHEKSKRELLQVSKQLDDYILDGNLRKIIMDTLSDETKNNLPQQEINDTILTELQSMKKKLEKVYKETCFPSNSIVQTERAHSTPVSKIELGDKVLTVMPNGLLVYQDVFLISHSCSSSTNLYIKITTHSGNVVHISPNHCLQVGELDCLKMARDVKVNDVIFKATGSNVIRDCVSSVEMTMLQGAYCPYTLNGTIVVDGIAASCFTTTASPAMSQRLLTPLRFLYVCTPLPLYRLLFSPNNVRFCLNLKHGIKNFFLQMETYFFQK